MNNWCVKSVGNNTCFIVWLLCFFSFPSVLNARINGDDLWTVCSAHHFCPFSHRKLWQLTLATKLFVEHIMLHHENTVAFARRIYTVSFLLYILVITDKLLVTYNQILKHKKNMDFSNGTTIDDVQNILKTVILWVPVC